MDSIVEQTTSDSPTRSTPWGEVPEHCWIETENALFTGNLGKTIQRETSAYDMQSLLFFLHRNKGFGTAHISPNGRLTIETTIKQNLGDNFFPRIQNLQNKIAENWL